MKFPDRFLLLLLLLSSLNLFAQPKEQSVFPTAEQVAWANAEIGVLIHYDINLFAVDSFDYKRKETLPNLSLFNPSKLNTDQWIKAAKAAGAKYAVLVVKHGTGFTLWPSKVNPYNVGNTPWLGGNGDILTDFIRSCKKYGIAPGVYYNTNYNTYYEAGYLEFKDSTQKKEYNKAVYAQLKELWTGYGKLFEIWFDGGVASDEKGGIATSIAKLIKENQSQAILFQGPVENKNLVRWVGNERGRAPYPLWSRANTITSATGAFEIENLNGDPNGKIWCPGEADFPLRKDSNTRGGFMWNPNSEHLLLSVDELMDSYNTSVGRNANMLLGMVIDTAGLCPEPDVKRLQEFGDKLKSAFSQPIAATNGIGKQLILDLGKEQEFNYVVLMEQIEKGEQVRKYSIEGFDNNKWQKIDEGVSIGHKRIHQLSTVKASKLRLTILESAGPVTISSFACYNVK